MNQKKPLCKFKETCPQWKANQSCGFDHVLCKFNLTCKKQNCLFYHNPKANFDNPKANFDNPKANFDKPKGNFDKPKSQTLCKFNGICNKPGCPFKHQKGEGQPRQSISPAQRNQVQQNPRPPMENQQKICRFDPACIRQNCRFKHPQRQAQNQQKNGGNNQSRRQQAPQTRFEPENSFGNNQSSSRGIENNFCLNFLLGNNCQNGQKCQKTHEFTDKASVKRIFFTNNVPERDFNTLFYEHQKEDDPQNKEPIYVLQERDTLSFRKLISAQNLYKDFGGIGSNQPNQTYLRSASYQLFKSENLINGIQAFTYNRNQYLVYMAGMKIQIYNTTKGEVDSFSTPREGNKLTGCALISEKGVLLVATSEIGLKRFQFNTSRQKFQETPFNDLTIGLKTFKISESQVLGQKVIYGVTISNDLILMNTDIKMMTLPFGNGAIVNDAEVCLINNKVPVVLVSVSFGGRKHQIVAINLLNIERETIIQYEFSAGLDKIFTIENHLMIEVKNKGLLVFKINEFEKEIGMIPLLNEIQEVRKDNKGNLLILQRTSASSKGSISIFKIKRI